jgi:hypothetical protein
MKAQTKDIITLVGAVIVLEFLFKVDLFIGASPIMIFLSIPIIGMLRVHKYLVVRDAKNSEKS